MKKSGLDLGFCVYLATWENELSFNSASSIEIYCTEIEIKSRNSCIPCNFCYFYNPPFLEYDGEKWI